MPIDAPDLRLLFERHSGSLLRFAGGRTSDPEDAVAETFLRAFRSMPPELVVDEQAQRAWLFRVLRNLTISAARRRTVTERHFQMHRSAAGPDDSEGGREHLLDLDLHLAKLPERQRVVLELRFVHDLDVEATAAALGLTLQATRALSYRALTQLRGSLRESATTTPGSHTT